MRSDDSAYNNFGRGLRSYGDKERIKVLLVLFVRLAVRRGLEISF